MNARLSILLGLALVGLSSAGFDPCKFNFGKGWTKGTNLSGVDFATIYAGDGGFNDNHHGAFVTETFQAKVTPMLYGYITAFMARENGGLKDCDQGTPNLCQNGAEYIRNNRSKIIDMYGTYSQKIAAVWGANALVIWLIEPDLYQYSVSGSNQRKAATGQEQAGGGIPDADIAKYFKDIATKIRQYMPNAQVGVDLSPWIANPNSYYGNFDKSIINYAFTSGGRTEAASSKIRTADKMTWSGAHTAVGKPILADCGYGVGGGKDGHHSEWDNVSNLKARINDGVISINQFDARGDWATSVLSSLRPQLPTFCSTPSSAAVSSSLKPSSSSALPPSSSLVSSSSIKPSSSSSKPSSSSVYVPPSSSSSKPSSSSTSNPPSSTSGTTNGSWSVVNGQLNSPTESGVAIGAGNNWNDDRVITKILGTITSGKSYTLSFDTEISAGGQTMDVKMAVGSYCNKTLSLTGGAVANQSCQFTANTSGTISMVLTVPGSRWETLTISKLSLVDGNGQQANTLFGNSSLNWVSKSILLRSGSQVSWSIPANSKVEVFHVSGKPMLLPDPAHLDLSSLPLGLYIIRAKTGTTVLSRKTQNF